MFAPEPNSKNQHYVWQHYLNAWAAEQTFCCYRQKDRMLIQTQPKSVASQTYFYEAQELTPADWKYLEAFIGQATDSPLRKLNREYVELTQIPFKMRAALAKANLPPEARAAMETQLRWAERNLGERYHANIENNSQAFLDALRNQNSAFYDDPDGAMAFLYYLSLQYFRTDKMRQGQSNVATFVPGHDPRRTAAILNHIGATNVGASLVREREAYQITFLNNSGSVPFITGDQPVINMFDPKKTDDVELYYPLAPQLAMVLSKDPVRFPRRARSVGDLEIERYNYAIYAASEDQVYSNDETYLRSVTSVGKHALPR